jgi:hypothetical protein
LALGFLFHLWLEYSLNIPLFQQDILSAYVLFIEPNDLARLGAGSGPGSLFVFDNPSPQPI